MFDIPPKEPDLSGEQVNLFKKLWDDRVDVDGKRRSEVSGEILSFNFAPSMYFCFSHVHSKGACPKLKLCEENIVLMTFKEHNDWEFNRHSLLGVEKWNWVFDRFEKLKHKCNGEMGSNK